MDLPQNENRKLILPILICFFVLAVGILVSVLYIQRKNAKIQSQSNPVQQPQGESLPAPSNIPEPPELPDIIPPTDEENIPVPSNVPEPSESFYKIPSSNGEEIPPPLP